MILGRLSKCIGRADIIEFGKQNFNKFRSIGLLKNGVPSEPTLSRVENGLDNNGLVNKMVEFMGQFHLEFLKGKGALPEIIC